MIHSSLPRSLKYGSNVYFFDQVTTFASLTLLQYRHEEAKFVSFKSFSP